MSLSNNEQVIQMELNLKNSRQIILNRKRLLLEDFKKYSLKKLKELGKEFKMEYQLLNDREDLSYSQLNIGETIYFEKHSLKFNPQTDMISGHVQKIYKGKKQTKNFIENSNMPGNSYFSKTSEPYSFSVANPVIQQKIAEEMYEKAKNILISIFNGTLVFEDEEYKRLVATNIALEQEFDRLNGRIEALISKNNNEKGKQKIK